MKHTNYPYKRYLENKARVTLNGRRYRLGNPNHPYNSIYKRRGMEAAFTVMELIPSGLEQIKLTVSNLFAEVKSGHVYVMLNPSFSGWVKVGMAVDAEDRIKQFQTGSPHRDYNLIKYYAVSDRRKAEKKAHDTLTIEGRERKGEWFYMEPASTVKELNNLFGEGAQLELF
jgi:hypothetical protein